ncbi:MAG: hypothetical protein MZV63_52715 [Marinilabiliales bacterium]|nr:hypothetical protein [Marinilabiliales bacterium]
MVAYGKISVSYSMQRDTFITFMAGNKKWDKEKHTTVKTVSSGVISAVIENQAEMRTEEFVFDSDYAEQVNLIVTGQGSHSESSNYVKPLMVRW